MKKVKYLIFAILLFTGVLSVRAGLIIPYSEEDESESGTKYYLSLINLPPLVSDKAFDIIRDYKFTDGVADNFYFGLTWVALEKRDANDILVKRDELSWYYCDDSFLMVELAAKGSDIPLYSLDKDMINNFLDKNASMSSPTSGARATRNEIIEIKWEVTKRIYYRARKYMDFWKNSQTYKSSFYNINNFILSASELKEYSNESEDDDILLPKEGLNSTVYSINFVLNLLEKDNNEYDKEIVHVIPQFLKHNENENWTEWEYKYSKDNYAQDGPVDLLVKRIDNLYENLKDYKHRIPCPATLQQLMTDYVINNSIRIKPVNEQDSYSAKDYLVDESMNDKTVHEPDLMDGKLYNELTSITLDKVKLPDNDNFKNKYNKFSQAIDGKYGGEWILVNIHSVKVWILDSVKFGDVDMNGKVEENDAFLIAAKINGVLPRLSDINRYLDTYMGVYCADLDYLYHDTKNSLEHPDTNRRFLTMGDAALILKYARGDISESKYLSIVNRKMITTTIDFYDY